MSEIQEILTRFWDPAVRDDRGHLYRRLPEPGMMFWPYMVPYSCGAAFRSCANCSAAQQRGDTDAKPL